MYDDFIKTNVTQYKYYAFKYLYNNSLIFHYKNKKI